MVKPNKARDNAIYATPILSRDTGSRLDAIVRRHGGKPKTMADPSKVVLPAIGKRQCEGQLELGQDVDDSDADA